MIASHPAITKEKDAVPTVEQWKVYELTLTAEREYVNGYTEVEAFVDFSAVGAATIRRPAFWDGGRTWRVRFASPTANSDWTWRSTCSDPSDSGLHDVKGAVRSVTYTGSNSLLKHGLLRMSPGARNVVHADGKPFFVVGDTAWSLPWRATPETCKVYAADRHRKGFNATLLMTVQPDRDARGPRDRHSIGGFDVGFEDLSDGHLNQINVAYFQYMDKLMSILIDHEIVPVHQPVFQGYGWKGLRPLGYDAVPDEYARFCRYLVARYGAQPAIWLISADSTGLHDCVSAGGAEVHAHDAYQQPTGIHYAPIDGSQDPEGKGHWNRSHQAAEWLDFQWCQTGHGGQHDATKVSLMHDNEPIKAVANGEPTYEGISEPDRSIGWWQGNEAWTNITAGGTMGHVYGVAALWQWKHVADEPGWPKWGVDLFDWRSALALEGSRYVGYVSKAFSDYDVTDMTKLADLAGGRPCVGAAAKLYVVYLPDGGEVKISGLHNSVDYRWFDPKNGNWREGGRTEGAQLATRAPSNEPWVLFVGDRVKK